MAQTTEIQTWWGRHRIPPERTDTWRIGPLEIVAEHLEQQWRLHWRHIAQTGAIGAITRSLGLTVEETSRFLTGPAPASAMSPYFEAKVRSITTPALSPNEDLIFSPMLPEESLVLSLGAPAVLDPGERLITGFQIPLTIRVETAAGQSEPRECCEIPLLPMARTWGGSTPLDGELALTPDVPTRVERWSALKPRLDVAGLSVVIVNRGTDPVFVDRLLIPCERLSLFHSPQTGFWCETLTLRADSDHKGLVEFEMVERTFPREAGATTLVAHARQAPHESAAMKGLANFRSTIRTTIGTSVENMFKERG